MAALAIATFVSDVAKLGAEVYLVRREQQPDRLVVSQAFTVLLLVGVAVAGLSFLAPPLLRLWYEDERFVTPLQVLLLAVPLMLICQPAFAVLERELNFRTVAFLELVGQLLFYTTAIGLALLVDSVWAPVTGFWLWQIWLVVGSFPGGSVSAEAHLVTHAGAGDVCVRRQLLGRQLGLECPPAGRPSDSQAPPRAGGRRLHQSRHAGRRGLVLRARCDVALVRRGARQGAGRRRSPPPGHEGGGDAAGLGVAPFLCIGAIGVLALPGLLGDS